MPGVLLARVGRVSHHRALSARRRRRSAIASHQKSASASAYPWFVTGRDHEKEDDASWDLLWGLAALFVLLWVLGFAFNYTMGGFIHVLLILAVISVLGHLILGSRHHRTA